MRVIPSVLYNLVKFDFAGGITREKVLLQFTECEISRPPIAFRRTHLEMFNMVNKVINYSSEDKLGTYRDFVSRNSFYPNLSEFSNFQSDYSKKGTRSHRISKVRVVTLKKVMDVTRYAIAPVTSGIPRVVRQLVKESSSLGINLAIWHKGRLVPVSCDSEGVITYPSEHWKSAPRIWSPQKYFVKLMRNPVGFSTLGLIFRFSLIRRLGSTLLRVTNNFSSGSARSLISISGLQYFLPEVPSADTAERLFVALHNNENLEITALVHDLLPVSHPHHFDRESTSEFLVYLQLVAKSRSLVVGSPVLGAQLGHFLSALGFGENTEISVHDLPVSTQEFKSTASSRAYQNEKTALFVGAFQSRKGLAGVAELFSKDRVGDLVLAVVGIPKPTDAQEMQLFRKVREHPRVKLLGNLSDEDLAVEMSKAVVIVYLSGAEGYGLPIIEGLAAGKPVVCLNTPINNYFNQKYGGLILVPHVNGQYSQADLYEALLSSRTEPFVQPTNLPLDEVSWARDVFRHAFTDAKDI